ncbi:MAG: HNH endonuclease signature motif containing protein [Actinomycetota bacterium]
METVLDPAVALKQLGADLDALLASDLEPESLGDARVLVELAASLTAKVAAVEVRLQEAVQVSGVFAEGGHRSAQTFCAHVARSSPARARRTGRLAGALRRLPVVSRRLAAGELGADQADRIASAMANPRARDGLAACDELIADRAVAWRFDDFSAWLADLVRAADPDGTRDANQRAHERRDARIVQGYDGTWTLEGGWASLEGAELHSIFEHFVDAEFQLDLGDARGRLGDDAAIGELARTPAQRRADALLAMARAAAADRPGGDGSKLVTNVVVDQATFERELTRLAGADPAERVPGADDGYCCETLDGHQLDPTETAAAALIGHVRRAVLGADSVTIDLGRSRRLFTGPARLAALLGHRRCRWPGCSRPATGCEIDHITEWHRGGRTDQANALPLCSAHNRHKHRALGRVSRGVTLQGRSLVHGVEHDRRSHASHRLDRVDLGLTRRSAR